MLDPRALANCLLDIADTEGVRITNLALNKIAYFVHGIYLANKEKPLIDAKIEAWQYGPVFREIYHQFKDNKDRAIVGRAHIFNPETEIYEQCRYELSPDDYEFICTVALPYIRMRPSALVHLSHIHDGPWHRAWFYDGAVNPGMEITNESIKEYFRIQLRH